nr:hypothetical protein [Actinomycetota bacterium]
MSGARLSTRAWGIAIIALAIAGAAVGSVASHDIEPSYIATTTLLVGDLDRPDLAKTDFQTSAMVASIYGGLIRSESVLGEVISRLDLPTDWRELRDRVHVDLGANEVPIISITVYAGSTAEAMSTASVITDRMLELSRPGIDGLPLSEEPAPSEEIAQIEQAISTAEQRLSRLEAKASPSLSTSHRVGLQQRIDRESSLLLSWQEVYGAQLSATVASANDLRILQPAETEGGKIRPHVAINAGLGASIGCLLGLVIWAAMGRTSAGRSRRPLDDRSTVRSGVDLHDALE